MTRKRVRKELKIKNIIQGSVPSERFDFIIEKFTRLRSEEMIEALRQHYVIGLDVELICLTVDDGNFSRADKKLNEAVDNLEKLKEMDWFKFGYKAKVNE